MSKSGMCITRTINLAKKPGKINQVFQDNRTKPNPFSCTKRIAQIQKIPTKTIRICTGAQLKKVCRPPCVCPPKKSSVTLLGLLIMLLKSVFFGSLVYYTWQAGLWGDSEESEKFLKNLCEMYGSKEDEHQLIVPESCEIELDMRPSGPPKQEKCKCARPPIENARMIYKLKEMWNHAIITIFEGIVGFPGNLSKLFPEEEEDKCAKK